MAYPSSLERRNTIQMFLGEDSVCGKDHPRSSREKGQSQQPFAEASNGFVCALHARLRGNSENNRSKEKGLRGIAVLGRSQA